LTGWSVFCQLACHLLSTLRASGRSGWLRYIEAVVAKAGKDGLIVG